MTPVEEGAIASVCARYGGDRTRLMDVFHELHQQHGHVSARDMELVAKRLAITRVEVESALSFYAFFSRQPRGRFLIRLCNDIIDRMHGLDRVAQAFVQELGIDFGQTTADGLFTLQWTPFIGMADQAPAALINEKVVTSLSSDAVSTIIKTLRETGDLAKLPFALGSGNNRHPLVRSMVKRNLRQRGPVLFGEPLVSGTALQQALAMSAVEVIDVIKVARLRGRGGAGFPTGMKWEFARGAEGSDKFVIANADEGEPGTFKDRVLLTEVPDLMFEGMTVAGYAVGAHQGIVYLRGEYTYLLPFLQHVLEERRQRGLLGPNIQGKGFDFDIRIQLGAGAYVCGEETALLSSCEGLRGDPKNRPPFPAHKGYRGWPTVVNNVETLCCVARILEKGGPWFNKFGTAASTGTKLFSVSGDCDGPGVYELPLGIKLGELLAICGGEQAKAVQVGGASGQMVSPRDFDRSLAFDDLASGGSIMVFGPERDVLEVVRAFVDFFRDESCGYCTPCRVGTRLMQIGLDKVQQGRGGARDLEYLHELGTIMKTMSRCGLGQTAGNPVLSSLGNLRGEYEKRLDLAQEDMASTFDMRRALGQAETIAGRQSSYFGGP